MATCGILAEIERVDLGAMMREHSEAFERPFHKAAGPDTKSFVKGK